MWWNGHNVQLPSGGVKSYEIPEAGRLTFEYTVVEVAGEATDAVQLVIYVPAHGTGTREKMADLLGSEAVAW